MRTLKKVLALSLVFAMAFTMMAGAAYKDQDQIDSSLNEDISLLTALGVFEGDENGNFNPTDNVRRSEAAKMIYVLKNNGVDDKAVAFQGVSKYSDVPVGHWAEGYINYCTNLGYMSGWQENGVQKFDPNGNVTGVELMKMLLCMIGYKADVQGYTNNSAWQTNVLVDAATSGLSVEFAPSVYSATPRQWTARLMVNAINAPFVTYNRGEISFGTAVDPTASYGEQSLKLETVTGVLNETMTNKLAANLADTVKTGSDEYAVVEVNGDNRYFKYEASNDLLGQEVKVYYRNDANVDDRDLKVYAIMATGDKKVIHTTVDAVSFDSDFANNGKVTIEGLGTKAYTGTHAGETIAVYQNYAKVQDYTMAQVKANDVLGVNSTLPVKIIADKDGYVETIIITGAPTYAIVSKLDAENGVFELEAADGSSVKLDNLDGDDIIFNKSNKENFAKYLSVDSDVQVDDVVECMATVDNGLVYTVSKVNVLGAATGYTVKDDGSYKTIKVDGTDYKLAFNHVGGYDWSAGTDAGTDEVFYTDGKYVVYSTGDNSGAAVNELAYLIDVGVSEDAFKTKTLKAKVLLADGTETTYTMNKKDGIGKDIVDADYVVAENLKDVVYTYSISDSVITLKKITPEDALDGNKATYMSATTSIAVDYKNNTAKVDGTTTYKTNDSTFFFVYDADKDDYAVVKASELKNNAESNFACTYVAQKVNGFETMLAGVLHVDEMPAAEAEDYYFVTGAPNYAGKVDDKYVVEMAVNAAGTESKLTFKYDSDSGINAAMQKLNGYVGKLVNADLKADGSVDVSDGSTGLTVISLESSATANKWTKGALTAWDGTNAAIGGDFVKIASDVTIYNVDVNSDEDSAELVEDSSIVYSEENEPNAVYLTNDDKEIVAIFIEIDGADISYVTNPVA